MSKLISLNFKTHILTVQKVYFKTYILTFQNLYLKIAKLVS